LGTPQCSGGSGGRRRAEDAHALRAFDTGFKSRTETWMVDVNGQNFQKFYPDSRGIVRVALKFTPPRHRAVRQ
jgi:hypothetical protein